jgi:hypothetical protein
MPWDQPVNQQFEIFAVLYHILNKQCFAKNNQTILRRILNHVGSLTQRGI